jgi:hypothetical protein
MIIRNSAQLITYLKTNFHKLTEQQYFQLLNNTLKVYPLEKPNNVNEAISTINAMSVLPIENRPLFV